MTPTSIESAMKVWGRTPSNRPTAHGFQEYWGYLYHLDAMQGVSFPDINKSPTEQTVAPPCKNTPIPGLTEVSGAVDPKTTALRMLSASSERVIRLPRSMPVLDLVEQLGDVWTPDAREVSTDPRLLHALDVSLNLMTRAKPLRLDVSLHPLVGTPSKLSAG